MSNRTPLTRPVHDPVSLCHALHTLRRACSDIAALDSPDPTIRCLVTDIGEMADGVAVEMEMFEPKGMRVSGGMGR